MRKTRSPNCKTTMTTCRTIDAFADIVAPADEDEDEDDGNGDDEDEDDDENGNGNGRD
jgi:hypothetical protein